MSTAASLFRWLQRKRYQYEVTFSLYMLTPTEKFIFNSFLFLFFSMIIIAATLYLPQHLAFLTNRAWFYYNGPSPEVIKGVTITSTAANAMETVAAVATAATSENPKSSSTLMEMAGQITATSIHKSILETPKEL
ncbi:hypothetical protein GcM3_076005 [Golovinomyces cichoracearum]|uniref:Uncharacterized protein n=1 Tax=Golovinomyces cichoracearum TaxID=62708 RepID=A0A420IQE8_9PEZI|nr:hypothetical protein GcM3_076005 [Golovinomyces cichoracearum]